MYFIMFRNTCVRFGTLSILQTSLFEQYNRNISQAYRQTSRRNYTCINKTANMVERTMSGTKTCFITVSSESGKEPEV